MPRFVNPIWQFLLCAALFAAPGLVAAQAQGGAGPLGDLSEYRTIAEDAMKLVKTGDFAGAHAKMKEFEKTWDNHEDSHKKKSYNTWKAIDNQLDFTLDKLSAKKPDQAACEKALDNLIGRLR